MSSDEPSKPKVPKRPSRLHVVNQKHCAAIGQAVISWNNLEFLVDRTIWKLVHKEQSVVACLTAQYNSVFARLNALISLMALYQFPKESITGLKKLQGSLSGLNEKRNRIVHDPRFKTEAGDFVRYEIVSKSSLSFGSREETISELEQFCVEVKNKRKKFLDLIIPVLALIEKSPTILQQRFSRISLSDLEPQIPTSKRGSRQRRT